MAINAQVVKDGDWGVLITEGDAKIMLLDADTAIKLGIHLIIMGQDCVHAKALQLVCIDKGLPPDTFVDLWNSLEQYVMILNSNQKDVDGNDTSD